MNAKDITTLASHLRQAAKYAEDSEFDLHPLATEGTNALALVPIIAEDALRERARVAALMLSKMAQGGLAAELRALANAVDFATPRINLPDPEPTPPAPATDAPAYVFGGEPDGPVHDKGLEAAVERVGRRVR